MGRNESRKTLHTPWMKELDDSLERYLDEDPIDEKQFKKQIIINISKKTNKCVGLFLFSIVYLNIVKKEKVFIFDRAQHNMI